MSKKIKTTFSSFIKESALQSPSPIIDFTEQIPDERSSRNQKSNYDVNYQITIDSELIEITGSLNMYNSGRADEYEFEPDQFLDSNTESYYDNHWEEIESDILKAFYQRR